MKNQYLNQLYLATAMLLMGSCVSEHEEIGQLDEDRKIAFSTYINQGSRATDKTTFGTGDSFGLWGCKTNGDYNNSFPANFMQNTKVTKTETEEWEYSPLALWPTNAAERVSFIAIYPYNQAQSIASSYDYIVNIDPSQQEDVLWGTVTNAHANDRNGSAINGDATAASFEATTGSVNFKFKHALCKVQFQVKLDMDYGSLATATLKSLSLNNVYNTAKLGIKADLTGISWGTFSNSQNYTLLAEDITLTATGASIGDALLLIPQTYPTSANVSLSLTYDYTVEGETKTVNKDYPLYVNWEPGKSYNYTVSIPLNLETISVSADIEERDSDTSIDPESALPPNAVDLGLSVLWATHNVGASTPTDYGSYYAWGTLSTQTTYERNNYTHYNASGNVYDALAENIANDNRWDVAKTQWKGKWRLPTKTEFEELINNCTWEYLNTTNTEFNGVVGYKITSNKPGYTDNFIFLPAAGYKDTELNNLNTQCWYWTDTRTSEHTTANNGNGYIKAYAFKRLNTNPNGTVTLNYRYLGHTIRPVHPN